MPIKRKKIDYASNSNSTANHYKILRHSCVQPKINNSLQRILETSNATRTLYLALGGQH